MTLYQKELDVVVATNNMIGNHNIKEGKCFLITYCTKEINAYSFDSANYFLIGRSR